MRIVRDAYGQFLSINDRVMFEGSHYKITRIGPLFLTLEGLYNRKVISFIPPYSVIRV